MCAWREGGGDGDGATHVRVEVGGRAPFGVHPPRIGAAREQHPDVRGRVAVREVGAVEAAHDVVEQREAEELAARLVRTQHRAAAGAAGAAARRAVAAVLVVDVRARRRERDLERSGAAPADSYAIAVA